MQRRPRGSEGATVEGIDHFSAWRRWASIPGIIASLLAWLLGGWDIVHAEEPTGVLTSAGATKEHQSPVDEDWSVHFQSTIIGQAYPGFHSPFQGANSLPGGGQGRETISGTAFLGRRLPWQL